MSSYTPTYHAILDAPDLHIGYKSKRGNISIASHLNLHIYEGEMVCLLGPNGSGKSTLIRTLAGMQKPLSGDIYIQNKRMHSGNLNDVAKKMSVVLTEKIDLSTITVFELVALGRFPYTNWYGKLTKNDTQAVENALIQVNLETYADRFFCTLSDGEKQRTMIAKALAQDTPFIMLDEPTAHLDLPNRIEIMKLLKNLARNTFKSILLSTHELDLALQLADRIWLMQSNKPMLCGTPEDLVLNGSFEQAFKKQSFDFDISDGLFKIVYEYTKSVSVEGEPTRLFWTKRALSRHGFKVEPKQTDIPHITVFDTAWEITHNNTKEQCSTIFELLIALSQKHTKH